MVIYSHKARRGRGFVLIEAAVAIAILLLATIPLASWMMSDARSLHDAYSRAIAVELVDGEMETLVAGAWRNYSEGTNVCHPAGNAARNLPPGQFLIIRHGDQLQLRWTPSGKCGIGAVTREATVK